MYKKGWYFLIIFNELLCWCITKIIFWIISWAPAKNIHSMKFCFQKKNQNSHECDENALWKWCYICDLCVQLIMREWYHTNTCSTELCHGANTEQVSILCDVATKVVMKCHIHFSILDDKSQLEVVNHNGHLIGTRIFVSRTWYIELHVFMIYGNMRQSQVWFKIREGVVDIP